MSLHRATILIITCANICFLRGTSCFLRRNYVARYPASNENYTTDIEFDRRRNFKVKVFHKC